MLAASAATLSMALSVPGAALADPAPKNADVPLISTTEAQPAEDPGGEETAPAPETSDELYPGPAEPPASEAPSQSSEVPDTGTPESEVPSSEAPAESSAPSASESAKPAPERQSRMAVAAGCQTYPPTTFQVCGRIRDKYNQTGGPTGFLLLPKSNELTNPGNTGKRSEFLGGNIYWSAATDAHPVAHDFLTKWGDYGYETGHMKYPTTDEIVMTGGRRQEFQGAAIYWSLPTGAHNVQGTIRTKYLALGGPGGALGWPTSDEKVTPDGNGRYNTFERGAIYWSAATGAHAVSGLVGLMWANDGYEAGQWGYPTGAQTVEGTNVRQSFQGGVIRYSTANPVKETIQGCTFNQEWPHKSGHVAGTVDAPIQVTCDSDRRKIEATGSIYFYPESDCDWTDIGCGGVFEKHDFSLVKPVSGNDLVRSLKTGNDQAYPAPSVECKNGDYRVVTKFTVTNLDGTKIEPEEHRTNKVTINNCD